MGGRITAPYILIHGVKMNKAYIFILFIYLFILCSCSIKSQEVNNISSTSTSVSISLSSTLGNESEINFESLTIGENTQGQPHLTGQLTSNIVIDADVISSSDLEIPDTGYTYSGNIPAFSDNVRNMFVNDNLTLIRSETSQCGNSTMLYSGTVYRDTYTDQNDNGYQHIAFPDSVVWYSEHGYSIHCFAINVAPDQLASEDFSFASEKGAYEQAAAVLAKEGIPVASCYQVKRLPYTALESAYLLSKSYGEDVSSAEKNLPNGWTEKENAYLFTMRYELNKFPVSGDCSGCLMNDGEIPSSNEDGTKLYGPHIEVLVTSAGVEFVYITLYTDNCLIQSEGQLCSLNQALYTFFQALHSSVQNESLYSLTKYANGEITITNIELSYVCFQECMNTEVSIVPCWQIRCERNINKDDPQRGNEFAWAYINALTGEYINTTTNTGSGI